jgi:hypothetical protein
LLCGNHHGMSGLGEKRCSQVAIEQPEVTAGERVESKGSAALGGSGGVPSAPSPVKALRFAPTANAALRGLDRRLRCGCSLVKRSMSASLFSREPGFDSSTLSGYPVALLRKWSMVVRMASCLRRGRL